MSEKTKAGDRRVILIEGECVRCDGSGENECPYYVVQIVGIVGSDSPENYEYTIDKQVGDGEMLILEATCEFDSIHGTLENYRIWKVIEDEEMA